MPESKANSCTVPEMRETLAGEFTLSLGSCVSCLARAFVELFGSERWRWIWHIFAWARSLFQTFSWYRNVIWRGVLPLGRHKKWCLFSPLDPVVPCWSLTDVQLQDHQLYCLPACTREACAFCAFVCCDVGENHRCDEYNRAPIWAAPIGALLFDLRDEPINEMSYSRNDIFGARI